MAAFAGSCLAWGPPLSKTSPLAPHRRVREFPHHPGAELDHSCRRQMRKIIRKSKTIPLGNAGHGITCNGRGLELPGLHPRPRCIPDFPRASTDSARVSPSPAGFSVLHFPARFPAPQILVEVLGSCLGSSRGKGRWRVWGVGMAWRCPAGLGSFPALPLSPELT